VVNPLDPEIEAFAKGKGIDLAEVQKSPTVQKVLRSAREAEAEMNRLRGEVNKLKEQSIAAIPDQVAGVQAPAVDDVSPVAKVKSDYKAALDATCANLGVGNENELRINHPEEYAKLHNMYISELTVANADMYDWKEKQSEKAREKEERERKAVGFVQNIKATASSNLNEFRQNIKGFDEGLVRSGASQVLNLISDAMGVTPEYLQADKRVMSFFAKASAAIATLESGEYKQSLKNEWEKQRTKQQEAMVPDGSLDGNVDVFAAKAIGRGTSLR
jgi:hypothetical protein